jgi:hypothetical protein
MYLQQISLHRQLEDSANEQQTKGFIVLTHKKRASSSSSPTQNAICMILLFKVFIKQESKLASKQLFSNLENF